MKKIIYALLMLLTLATAFADVPNPGHSADSVGPGTMTGDIGIKPGTNSGESNLWFNIDNFKSRIVQCGTDGCDTNMPGDMWIQSNSGNNIHLTGFGDSPTKVLVNGIAQTSGGFRYAAGDGNPWWITGTANGPAILLQQYHNMGGNAYRRGSLGWMDNLGVKTEILTWGDSGNIGIGVTNPTAKLEVAGRINATGDICTAVGNKCLSTAGGGGFWAPGNNANDIHNTNTGNVGIGTTTPGAPLDVRGGIDIYNSGSSLTQIRHFDNGGTQRFYWSLDTTNNQLLLKGAPSSNVIASFSNNGYVGIGTTNPSNTLEVNGDFGITGPGLNSGIKIATTGKPLASPGNNMWMMRANSDVAPWNTVAGSLSFERWIGNTLTTPLMIATNGNVGIGTTSPGGPLEISSTNDNILVLRQTDGVHPWNYIEWYGSGARQWWSGMTPYNTFTISPANPTIPYAFNIDLSGRVGIGTMNPIVPLHIKAGYARIFLESTNAGTDNWLFQTDSSPAAGLIFNDMTSGKVPLFLGNDGSVGIGTTSPDRKLSVNGNADFWVGTTASNPETVLIGGGAGYASVSAARVNTWANTDLRLGSQTGNGVTGNGVNVMTLTSAGNVGIGTEDADKNVDKKLRVVGDVRIGNGNPYYDVVLQSGSPLSPQYDGVFEIYPKAIPGSGTAKQATYFKSGCCGGSGGKTQHDVLVDGSVGIGTTPGVKLDVEGMPIINGDARHILYLTDDSPFAAGVGAGLSFLGKYNSAGARANFASIKGIKESSTNGDYAGALVFMTTPYGLSPTERMRVTSTGKVGIGMIPATNTLEVNGQASKSAAGSWLGNSDERLKKNIKPLNSALDKVLALKPVTFEWKQAKDIDDSMPADKKESIQKGSFPNGTQMGFVAQQNKDIVPTLVKKGDDGYYMMEYGSFDPLVISAIQEQQQQIEELKSENNALKQRVEALEAQ